MAGITTAAGRKEGTAGGQTNKERLTRNGAGEGNKRRQLKSKEMDNR